MNKYKLLILMCIFFAMLTKTHAQPQQPMKLNELASLTLKNANSFKAASMKEKAGREETAIGRSLLYPTIIAYGQYSDIDNDNDFSQNGTLLLNPQERYQTNSIGLMLKQPIFRKDLAAINKQSKTLTKLSTIEFSKAKQNLIFETLETYFSVINAEQIQQINRADVKSKKAFFDTIKTRKEQGATNRSEFLEAKASYEMSLAQSSLLNQNVSIAYQNLSILTGIPISQVAKISAFDSRKLSSQRSVADLIDIAYQNNPNILQAKFKMELEKHTTESYQARNYPSVDLVAKIDKSDGQFEQFGFSGDTLQKSLVLEFSIPLSTGGNTRSKIKQSKLNYQSALYELKALKDLIRIDLTNTYQTILTLQFQIAALKTSLQSANSSVLAKTKSYQLGVTTSLDVLNAQSQYIRAQNMLNASINSLILSYFKLKLLSGNLAIEDLSKIASIVH